MVRTSHKSSSSLAWLRKANKRLRGARGMSREIKFRAWDKETREMSYDFLSKNWIRVCIESPYVELMQYTGLKDKNGKDIYEGDRVLIPYNRLGTITVEMVDGAYNISKYRWEVCEVVGNICEQT